MPSSSRRLPSLTPATLVRLVSRPLPPALLGPGLALALGLVRRRHPDLFGRLAGLGAPVFLIDAVELPFVFLLEADPEVPRLAALRRTDPEATSATATIRGPLMRLIDLLEGRVDGDALFFSRDLEIEGDTEAVVALRNAVDGAEIDLLGDLLSILGPLSGPVRRVADGVLGLAARAARDFGPRCEPSAAPDRHSDGAGTLEPREVEAQMAARKRSRRRAPRRTRGPAVGART